MQTSLAKLDAALKVWWAERGSADPEERVPVIIGLVKGTPAPDAFEGVPLDRLGPTARTLEATAPQLARLTQENWVAYLKHNDQLGPLR